MTAEVLSHPFFSLVAKGFLSFSHDVIIAPLLTIGFFTQGGFFIRHAYREGADFWGNATLLVLFTMVFSPLLKSLFLVPLDPALGIEGFAFPSGHMQVSVVFYGTLFHAYRHLVVRSMLLVILAGIAYGLIQQGYHTLMDVAGAVIFAIVTLYAFSNVTLLAPIQKNSAYLGICLIPLTGMMMGIIYMRTGISPHLAKTFIGLVGFSLLWLGLNASVWKRG